MFDPVAERPDAALASRIVWFDAFVTNLDRTCRNTNMLMWHGRLQLIDHGAALYFHHTDGDWAARAGDPFTLVREHVLLPFAAALPEADAAFAPRLDRARLGGILAMVPDAWLESADGGAGRAPRAVPRLFPAPSRLPPCIRRGGPACTRAARMTTR